MKGRAGQHGGERVEARRGTHALALGLILLAAACVYSAARDFAFTNWDDDTYILSNPMVRAFGADQLRAVFTTTPIGNYHPLTMLSYALDWRLGQGSPHVFHLTNILLHAANSVLLYWLLWLLFRRTAVALPAALLFVVHPLQVESVAWVAERKNVLACFFLLAACVAYARRRPGAPWLRALGPAFALFLAALLSKATAVTLPVLLLLIDVFRGRRPDRAAWREKIPFFAASLLAGVVAFWAQRVVSGVHTKQPFWWRDGLFVACRGLIFYLVKTVAPWGLSPVYPYPPRADGALLPWDFLAAPVAVLVLAALIVWWGRRASPATQRLLLLGVGWFLVNIAPVLQLLPVGDAVAADRYFYVPGIGLLLLAGAGFGALWTWSISPSGRAGARVAIVAAGLLGVVGLGWRAREQTVVWRDGMSLWDSVLARYPWTPAARANRSELFFARGEFDQGLADLDQAVTLNPRDAKLTYNRACAWLDRGDLDRALADLDRAIALDPTLKDAYVNRGFVDSEKHDFRRAVENFDQVIALAPADGMGYRNRAVAYYNLKDYDRAWADIEAAQQRGFPIDPQLIAAVQAGRTSPR